MLRFLRRMSGSRQLKIVLAGATHHGKQRDHNEDAFAVLQDQLAAVVADGMGGLARGEIASGMVASVVAEAMQQGRSAAEGLVEAHRRIRETSISAGSERMGSTAVTLHVVNGEAIVEWVGDSRAYLWRDQTLRQITKDHSFVEELVAAGAISADDAETHPNRNVLTRAVGIRDTLELKVDSTKVALQAGDRLLLCTDGLHGYLPRSAIIDCLKQGGDADTLVQRLIEHTLNETEAGDNITAVCATVEG